MIAILGRGSHAYALMDLAESCGVAASAAPYEEMDASFPPSTRAILGVGCSADTETRARLYASMRFAPARALVAPSTIGRRRRIDPGSAIFPMVTLGAGVVVGQNVVIYSGCVVEHGSTIGDHAWLSPGAILCGNVTVKPRAFLGACAIVLPGLTIGAGAIIGAGAVIHGDVHDGETVFGPVSR